MNTLVKRSVLRNGGASAPNKIEQIIISSTMKKSWECVMRHKCGRTVVRYPFSVYSFYSNLISKLSLSSFWLAFLMKVYLFFYNMLIIEFLWRLKYYRRLSGSAPVAAFVAYIFTLVTGDVQTVNRKSFSSSKSLNKKGRKISMKKTQQKVLYAPVMLI